MNQDRSIQRLRRTANKASDPVQRALAASALDARKVGVLPSTPAKLRTEARHTFRLRQLAKSSDPEIRVSAAAAVVASEKRFAAILEDVLAQGYSSAAIAKAIV